MKPTTLFSNHDEITYAANAPVIDEQVVGDFASEQHGERTIGSSSFSMFNDDTLRASRGFHLSAKAIIALAVAVTLGGYAVARESKARNNVPVVEQEPVQSQEPVASEPTLIDPTTEAPAPAPTPGVSNVERKIAQPIPAPAPRTVGRPASSTTTPAAVPMPTPVIIATPPVAEPAPAAPVVEVPAIPVPTTEPTPAPAPVVDPPPTVPAPPVELPPAPAPAPVEPAAPAAPTSSPAPDASAPAPVN